MCDIGCFDFTGRGKKGNDQFFIHGCFIGLSVSACFSEKTSVKIVRSGSYCSSTIGSVQPWEDQTAKISGTPLPARSPIPIILNIFIRALFLGSEMPPLSICSLPVRIYPGFSKMIQFLSFFITIPLAMKKSVFTRQFASASRIAL